MVDMILGGVNFGNESLSSYDEANNVATPSFTFATPGDLSFAPSNNINYYTKIGRQVFLTGRLSGTPTYTTSSGNARITNLPFTANDLSEGGSLMLGIVVSFNNTMVYPAGTTALNIYAAPNTTYMEIYGSGSATAAALLTTTQFPTGVAFDLYWTLAYFTN